MAEPEGHIEEPRWTWKDDTGTVRVGRATIVGKVSLAALWLWVSQRAPEAAMRSVHIVNGVMTWERPATASERSDWGARRAQQAGRQYEWERRTLARLFAKYGTTLERCEGCGGPVCVDCEGCLRRGEHEDTCEWREQGQQISS